VTNTVITGINGKISHILLYKFLIYPKIDNVKGPTHSTVEAGACWSTGGSGGGSLSVNATVSVAGVIPK